MDAEAAILYRVSYEQLAKHIRNKGEADDEIQAQFANLSFARYTKTGDRDELDTAIKNAHLAVQKTRDNHPRLAERLDNLRIMLTCQHEVTRDAKYLDEAIRVADLAVKSTPNGHAKQSSRLLVLSNGLACRYEETGQTQDEERAVDTVELALKLAPDNHPDQGMALQALGAILGVRYVRTGQVEHLEAAITLGQKSMKLIPEDRLRWVDSHNLGNNLHRRYKLTGQIRDLEEAIRLEKVAINSRPDSHLQQANCMDILGSRLYVLHSKTGERKHLEEAIQAAEGAIKLVPLDYSDRPRMLTSLALKLKKRFEITGQIRDLNESVRLAQLAVNLSPEGSTHRHTLLTVLANYLEIRYEKLGKIQDLDEAIRIAELGVNSTPDSEPDELERLNNLRGRLKILREQAHQTRLPADTYLPGQNFSAQTLQTRGLGDEPEHVIYKSRRELAQAGLPAPEGHPDSLVKLTLRRLEIVDTFDPEDFPAHLDGITIPVKTPSGQETALKYPQLPKGHVRFLKVIGAGPHPYIDLESHPLESAPAFTAISYSWGEKDVTRKIFLNNIPFAVSEHLADALNQLWLRVPRHQLIWVDRICINQEDDAEKADQLPGMRDVYAQADQVLVWMGATANSSDELFENMVEMLSRLRSFKPGMKLTASGVSMHLWHALGHFYTRSWFRRLWIVQALLAKKLTLVCGSRQTDWNTLVLLTHHLHEANLLREIVPLGMSLNDVTPGFISVLQLATFRLMKPGLKGLPLYSFLALLEYARECQVGLEVDRIWALLAVAPADIRAAAVPLIDYSSQATKNYWETYMKFVKVLISKDPGLCVLSLVYSQTGLDELPSWCPNFNSPPAPLSRIQAAWKSFRSGISTKTKTRTGVSFSADTRVLLINGFRVDRVDKIVEHPQYPDASSIVGEDRLGAYVARGAEEEYHWERRCLQLARSVYRMPNGVPEAHWCTLIVDHIQFPDKLCSRWDRAGYDLVALGLAGQDPSNISRRKDVLRQAYLGSFMEASSGRSYISTKGGRVGLAPPGTQEGDAICVFYGAPLLYILRFDNSGAARLIGDSFVYGLMYGEALKLKDRGEDEIIRIK